MRKANTPILQVIQKVLGGLWKIYILILLVALLVLLYPFYYVLLTRPAFYRWGFMLTRVHAKILLWAGGIFVKKINDPPFVAPPYVIIANHTSYLDILLLYYLFREPFVFMGKKELTKIPLFNIFFKQYNIPVDRGSITESHKAFKEAAIRIDQGYSIAIYPEGTIPRHAPVMKRFKPGAFRLAKDKQVPIVPVLFIDNWRLMGDKALFSIMSRPGIARVEFLTPLFPEDLSAGSVDEWQQRMRDIFMESMNKYKPRKVRK